MMTTEQFLELLGAYTDAVVRSVKAHNGMGRGTPEVATRVEQLRLQDIAKVALGRKLTATELAEIGG